MCFFNNYVKKDEVLEKGKWKDCEPNSAKNYFHK